MIGGKWKSKNLIGGKWKSKNLIGEKWKSKKYLCWIVIKNENLKIWLAGKGVLPPSLQTIYQHPRIE